MYNLVLSLPHPINSYVIPYKLCRPSPMVCVEALSEMMACTIAMSDIIY